jgi:hypothetical protein
MTSDICNKSNKTRETSQHNMMAEFEIQISSVGVSLHLQNSGQFCLSKEIKITNFGGKKTRFNLVS